MAFRAYCVFTASFVGNSAGMDAGYAGSMTARRDAIGQFPYCSDSVTSWARGDGWRLRGAGMHAPPHPDSELWAGGSGKTAGSRGDGCIAIAAHLPRSFCHLGVAEKGAAGS